MPLTIKDRKGSELEIAWDRFKLDLGQRTHLMGILNCTPDSFSDGGRFFQEKDAVSRALNMVGEGADIIDVGGESTRPGSVSVSVDEELKRVIPVIERLKTIIDLPISIDTSKSYVAEIALKSGASMVNDITGLRGDIDMAGVVAKYDVPVIVMHMKGRPCTMQLDPKYDNLVEEIITSLKESINLAKIAGVDEKKIIVDPGIGFGKRLEHNLQIIRELYRLKILNRPIMIGTSRKSFIGQILDRDVNERLMGTAASIALAISNGANIVRVHDVNQMKEVARVADSICKT